MRCGWQSTAGTQHWSWLRSTICMKKIDGRWLIAHDHCSTPFDPVSNQAMLDAGPEELKKVA
jgi:ketosteroid isomerase-like protein